MTLQRFETLLKRINPRLKLRHRRTGDVVGLFVGRSSGRGYICRLGKGELHLTGYSHYFKEGDSYVNKIAKRGRKTLIALLRNYRWVTNAKQRCMLTWGIDYPASEVIGLTGKDQYGP